MHPGIPHVRNLAATNSVSNKLYLPSTYSPKLIPTEVEHTNLLKAHSEYNSNSLGYVGDFKTADLDKSIFDYTKGNPSFQEEYSRLLEEFRQALGLSADDFNKLTLPDLTLSLPLMKTLFIRNMSDGALIMEHLLKGLIRRITKAKEYKFDSLLYEYWLYSITDSTEREYIGITKDWTRRLKEHWQNREGRFVLPFLKVEVLYHDRVTEDTIRDVENISITLRKPELNKKAGRPKKSSNK